MPSGNPKKFGVGGAGEAADMVRVELSRIIISDLQEEQIIVLKEIDGERKFPIVIGMREALAIDSRLKGQLTARPMTHDLLATVIEKLGGTVERIDILDLQDHTFFASIVVRKSLGKTSGKATGKLSAKDAAASEPFDLISVDSRPSDAIALGVATEVPIFVSEMVLSKVC